MAGHSHWANIQHQKARIDARRGKVFTKLARDITVAARMGGGDPDANIRLRYAIDKARAQNVTKDTIERAIKKGTGELGGSSYEEIVYEGWAPGGVAVLLNVVTDNRNRTAPEIRKIFDRFGGNLAGGGAVAWMFQRKGVITILPQSLDEDHLLEVAVSAGAEDVKTDDTPWSITSEPSAFEAIRKALDEAGIKLESAEITQVPQNLVKLGLKDGRKVLELLRELDDHDDVQNVFANFEAPEELLEEA